MGDLGESPYSCAWRMSITLDVSHYPLVLSKFDGEQPLPEIEEYIAKMVEVHRRRQPYVSVVWMRRYARTNEHTERIARWIKDTEETTREYCAGAAMITQSSGFRFALAAIFLIKPMTCPYLVCGTWSEGLAFARKHGEPRGLVIPDLACPWPELG